MKIEETLDVNLNLVVKFWCADTFIVMNWYFNTWILFSNEVARNAILQGPPNLWQRTFWPGSRIKTKKIENLLQPLIAK